MAIWRLKLDKKLSQYDKWSLLCTRKTTFKIIFADVVTER